MGIPWSTYHSPVRVLCQARCIGIVTRLLAIDADLSAPPSSPLIFRDVSLAASIRSYEVVAVAPLEMQDLYSGWFRAYGLFDYVEAIITPAELRREHVTVVIEGGPKARLTVVNVQDVIALL